MACTILNVKDPVVSPSVKTSKYGFADVDGSLLTGYANRMFESPCEESDIIDKREAIGIGFTVTNAPIFGAKFQFTVSYLRPGDSVKTSWVAVFTLKNGTYERYIYHSELKYIKGQYSGLTLRTDILK